jgi:ABC-type dipeptide/oligopeptide/nickel transport system permease component
MPILAVTIFGAFSIGRLNALMDILYAAPGPRIRRS